MAVDHVKAPNITNLDATPRVPPTAGEAGNSPLIWAEGYATAVASSSVDATYQLVRLPASAKVKVIFFESEAQGAGSFDLGVYYSTDLSSPQNPLFVTSLLAAAAIDQDFFAQAIDCSSAVVMAIYARAAGGFNIGTRMKPLWSAAGVTTDPGGNLDIVATVKTTAVTTGTGKFGIGVLYTN